MSYISKVRFKIFFYVKFNFLLLQSLLHRSVVENRLLDWERYLQNAHPCYFSKSVRRNEDAMKN